MRQRLSESTVKRDMYETTYSMPAMRTGGGPTELERARRRRDEAAHGSPDWDAASEAVVELEAADAPLLAEQPRRKLFLLEPSSVR